MRRTSTNDYLDAASSPEGQQGLTGAANLGQQQGLDDAPAQQQQDVCLAGAAADGQQQQQQQQQQGYPAEAPTQWQQQQQQSPAAEAPFEEQQSLAHATAQVHRQQQQQGGSVVGAAADMQQQRFVSALEGYQESAEDSAQRQKQRQQQQQGPATEAAVSGQQQGSVAEAPGEAAEAEAAAAAAAAAGEAAAAAAAAAASEEAEAAAVPVCWGWDLSLHPGPLQDAYWHEQAHRFMQWDTQVAWCLLVLVSLSVLRHSTSTKSVGPDPTVYVPAWLTLTTWLLLAIWAPKFYATHRVPLVLLLKSAMAASVLHITNDSARLMYLPHSTPSFRMMLFQTAMISGLAHLPGLCVGQPLPFWAQLAWAVGRSGIFVLGAASRELVTLTNTRAFLDGFWTSNTLWAKLVQSGQPWLIPPDDSLAGHTADMVAALATMHISAIAVSMYLAYMSQWVQQRAWLAAKASASLRSGPAHTGAPRSGSHTGGPQGIVSPLSQPHVPGHNGSNAHTGAGDTSRMAQAAAAAEQLASDSAYSRECPPLACVSGVFLSQQQLTDMCRSHAALLLLDGRGLLGRAAMVCFHAGIVNMILLLSWVVSHVLVLRVAPHVLPRLLLAIYYPPAPGVGGDVCGVEQGPQYSGLLGEVLMFIGGYH